MSDLKRRERTKSELLADIPSWLKIFTPHALPIEPLPGSGWLNGWLWMFLIRELKAYVGEQSALVVVGKPSVLALQVLDIVNPSRSIYDAMDDFPAFYSGMSRLAMRRRELRVMQRVSNVWVSSTALMRRWLWENKDVRFVPNAFDGALIPSPRLSVNEKKKKIFGYVGTIGAWFDWEWVLALAKLRSGDVIRLVGPLFHSAPVGLPKNIELLPPCQHEVALRVMSDFDVGLIPFKSNELTASVDPIKFYEYRALGLPVLSTDFGEMTFRADEAGVYICKTFDDIRRFAESAIEFRDSLQGCAEFAMKNTWEARFDAAGLFKYSSC